MKSTNIGPAASAARVMAACIAALPLGALGLGSPVPSQVIASTNVADTVRLFGNTHPLAQSANDRGRVAADEPLFHMYIVLARTADQERSLAAFNDRQQDPASPDYHHWLHADEFGLAYGPNDHDIAAVEHWLESNGLQVHQVSGGRLSIEFSGAAADVERAFNVEMHRYLVEGVERIANDRDPQVPRALSPVVGGVAALNNFPVHSDLGPGRYVKRDAATGELTPLSSPNAAAAPPAAEASSALPTPDFNFSDSGTGSYHYLTPYDFATIYNSLPLWTAKEPITGAGVSIAIVGTAGVNPNDIKTYRTAFGLPAGVPKVVFLGAEVSNSDEENTVDVEMVSAAAPGASITLVVGAPASGANAAIGPIIGSSQYIVDHETGTIVTASYGTCELSLGKSNNALFNAAWQQGATEGLSIFVAAGDQGSAACTPRSEGTVAVDGLTVNGIASSPYVTAVGGTDFGWGWISNGSTTYWNTTNSTKLASAKGYIPETTWNTSCANPFLQKDYFVTSSGTPDFASPEAVCNAAAKNKNFEPLLVIGGGSGGESSCTTPSGALPSTCSGGYAKPSWQSGTGVPADGKRDLPDVALFASYGYPAFPGTDGLSPIVNGSEVLFCYTGGGIPCSYGDSGFTGYEDIDLQGNGGTSAASPYWAGIMALILQKNGGARQGLANPTLYKLHSKESLSSCSSNTVKSGNSCVFYDITVSDNAQVCLTGSPDCLTKTSTDKYGILSGYSAGTGYDQATGLGSVNIANLVDGWAAVAPTPKVSLTPTSLAFSATAVGSTSAAKVVILKNTGTVAVTFTGTGITLTGTGAAQFVKTTTCGSALSIGASCTISIEFKPKAAGSAEAKLSVEDNASGAPQTVTLTGTGG
jgi:subtilase family serine protease